MASFQGVSIRIVVTKLWSVKTREVSTFQGAGIEGVHCNPFNYTQINCVVSWSFTGSVVSLVSGASFGGLLAYGAWQTSQNPKNFVFSFGEWQCSLGLVQCIGL